MRGPRDAREASKTGSRGCGLGGLHAESGEEKNGKEEDPEQEGRGLVRLAWSSAGRFAPGRLRRTRDEGPCLGSTAPGGWVLILAAVQGEAGVLETQQGWLRACCLWQW